MPEIRVTTRAGAERVLKGEAGTRLMEIIRDSGIDELEAMCGGNCACATCHVYIDAPWREALAGPGEDEQILLEGSEHYQPGVSRLSCQINVTPELDGLALAIAPEG